jgi:hypothetical protein
MKNLNLTFISIASYHAMYPTYGVFRCKCAKLVVANINKVQKGEWIHCSSGISQFELIMMKNKIEDFKL